eukprot:CAMPEP_0184711332 /NCGR_PEP_ID=MMETSP0314-20130426/2006_1 /TAXON_ID=38298 /ORGANISM="Rhodella maculata, Strain CCMP 736" /LENGTH=128 /DNA_ID=CAMNT_0027173413 /DNA_START=166 /DNA_END=552 /DNA_ORIENTATION=+
MPPFNVLSRGFLKLKRNSDDSSNARTNSGPNDFDDFSVPASLQWPDADRFSPKRNNAVMFKSEVSDMYNTGLCVPPGLSSKSEFQKMMVAEEKKMKNRKAKRSRGVISPVNLARAGGFSVESGDAEAM